MRGGGGHYGLIPVVFLTVRLYHSKFRTLLSWLFSFKFPAHFDTNLWRPGVRFWSYVTFCTCMSDQLNPMWFCVQNPKTGFCLQATFIAYLDSQWLKWISINLLQKVSATNFTPDIRKQLQTSLGSKNKEIHKKLATGGSYEIHNCKVEFSGHTGIFFKYKCKNAQNRMVSGQTIHKFLELINYWFKQKSDFRRN